MLKKIAFSILAVRARSLTTSVRLDKYLVDVGCASSRTLSASLIKKGRVRINGEIARSGKLKVDPDATISLDGVVIEEEYVPLLLAYHKPVGVHSTMSDQLGRKDLVSELFNSVPRSWQRSLHPVGRLDADTSGLLLFSSSGELTHRLLHPKRKINKQYLAHCHLSDTCDLDQDDTFQLLSTRLETGVLTATGTHRAKLISLQKVQENQNLIIQIRLLVSEGKHRMVRRMLANLGAPVIHLHRERFGPIELDSIPLGQIKPITDPYILDWAESLLSNNINNTQHP
mmetsp:Transcript_19137/g.23580  ORF Transcript_19137/g.23580 Transcript_19137/m.23580 type:complete len:285 (-) Transcript_19137:556-1410(-)